MRVRLVLELRLPPLRAARRTRAGDVIALLYALGQGRGAKHVGNDTYKALGNGSPFEHTKSTYSQYVRRFGPDDRPSGSKTGRCHELGEVSSPPCTGTRGAGVCRRNRRGGRAAYWRFRSGWGRIRGRCRFPARRADGSTSTP